MNILQNKIFSEHTTNFYARTKFNSSLKKYGDFDGLLIKNNYSINLPEHLFTNFLSGQETAQKKFVEQLKVKAADRNILTKGFDIRQIEEGKSDCDRLLNIINTYDDTNIEFIHDIFKCKFENEKSCQVYIVANKKDNILEVVLIDLYHLGLKGDFGKIPWDAQKIYKKRYSFLFDFDNILKN